MTVIGIRRGSMTIQRGIIVGFGDDGHRYSSWFDARWGYNDAALENPGQPSPGIAAT
jgi:hypothetical protein